MAWQVTKAPYTPISVEPLVQCRACRARTLPRDAEAHKTRCPGKPFTRKTLRYPNKR